MGRIGTDVWIRVIPQLIARIDIPVVNVRELLKQVCECVLVSDGVPERRSAVAAE
jgi:hypothetical protein